MSGGDGKHAQIVSGCHKVACGVETHLLDALAVGYLHRGYAYAVAVAIARGEHGADIIGPCHIVELKQSVLVVHHQGGAVGTHCHATARHAAQQVSVLFESEIEFHIARIVDKHECWGIGIATLRTHHLTNPQTLLHCHYSGFGQHSARKGYAAAWRHAPCLGYRGIGLPYVIHIDNIFAGAVLHVGIHLGVGSFAAECYRRCHACHFHTTVADNARSVATLEVLSKSAAHSFGFCHLESRFGCIAVGHIGIALWIDIDGGYLAECRVAVRCGIFALIGVG